jgi:broad specificity phosphatase PhoE
MREDARMTSKADFTDEEWTRLKRAPFVAGMAISLADPGGPIEAVRETAATLKTVVGAAEQGGHGDLVDALARDVAEEARQRKSPLAGFKPSRGAGAGVEILDELGEVNRIVSEKATPEEAAGVRAWLLAAAQEAANAAKEGGFMGFHAERVSEGEQRMLDRLGEVLADPAG